MFKKHLYFTIPFCIFFLIGFRSCSSSLTLGFPLVLTEIYPKTASFSNWNFTALCINFFFFAFLILLCFSIKRFKVFDKSPSLAWASFCIAITLLWSLFTRIILTGFIFLTPYSWYTQVGEYLFALDPLSYFVLMAHLIYKPRYSMKFENFKEIPLNFIHHEDVFFRIYYCIALLIIFFLSALVAKIILSKTKAK